MQQLAMELVTMKLTQLRFRQLKLMITFQAKRHYIVRQTKIKIHQRFFEVFLPGRSLRKPQMARMRSSINVGTASSPSIDFSNQHVSIELALEKPLIFVDQM